MSQKFFTLPEIKRAAKEYKYRLGECFNQNGESVVVRNGIHKNLEKWIDENVEPWTKRPATEPGAYFIYCYSDSHRKTKPDVYPIAVKMKKGELPTLSEPPKYVQQPVIIQHPATEVKDHPLSWEKALEYQSEISKLKGEVSNLTAENARLKKEIEDLEEGNEPGLAETAQSFIQSAMPAMDAYIADRQQQRILEFLKLQSQNPNLSQYAGLLIPQQRPQQRPFSMAKPQQRQQNNGHAYAQIIERANAFIDELDDDTYTKVEQIQAKAQDINQFFAMLQELLPDVYAQMYEYIYAESEAPNE